MKNSLKWKQGTLGLETTIDGYRVSRSDLQSGGHLYYVHWFENPHYAAHHCRMSSPSRSIAGVRSQIRSLEAHPLKYFNTYRLLQVKASLARIDAKFPEFCEQWKRLYGRYTRMFRKHDDSYQRMIGA